MTLHEVNILQKDICQLLSYVVSKKRNPEK